MVELVDHDVVEGLAAEALEVGCPPQGLDGREEDVGVRVAALSRVEAQARFRADGAEGAQGLPFRGRAAGTVSVDPVGRDLAGGGVGEQAVEGLGDGLEGVAFCRGNGPVVPLDAGEEG